MNSDYSNRNEYRNRVVSDLFQWKTQYKETELFICADKMLDIQAYDALVNLRWILDEYIAENETFKTSLVPLEAAQDAHPVIAGMCRAGKAADVGPMAAVAGAFAEYVGNVILRKSEKAIVENGGDIFMKTGDKRIVALFAGNSPLSMKIGIEVDSTEAISVCTSSGTVGPSLSFGKADAAVVISRDACLADACATRLGNELKSESDIQKALGIICAIEGVLGAVVVIGDKCGVKGEVELKVL
jgi:uncharacterized protein